MELFGEGYDGHGEVGAIDVGDEGEEADDGVRRNLCSD